MVRSEISSVHMTSIHFLRESPSKQDVCGDLLSGVDQSDSPGFVGYHNQKALSQAWNSKMAIQVTLPVRGASLEAPFVAVHVHTHAHTHETMGEQL